MKFRVPIPFTCLLKCSCSGCLTDTCRTLTCPGVDQVKGSQSSTLLCSQFTYVLFCMRGCYIIKIMILNKYVKDVICRQVRFCPGLTLCLHNGHQQELSALLKRWDTLAHSTVTGSPSNQAKEKKPIYADPVWAVPFLASWRWCEDSAPAPGAAVDSRTQLSLHVLHSRQPCLLVY